MPTSIGLSTWLSLRPPWPLSSKLCPSQASDQHSQVIHHYLDILSFRLFIFSYKRVTGAWKLYLLWRFPLTTVSSGLSWMGCNKAPVHLWCDPSVTQVWLLPPLSADHKSPISCLQVGGEGNVVVDTSVWKLHSLSNLASKSIQHHHLVQLVERVTNFPRLKKKKSDSTSWCGYSSSHCRRLYGMGDFGLSLENTTYHNKVSLLWLARTWMIPSPAWALGIFQRIAPGN